VELNCRLLELKRVNLELTKQNEDKARELSRLNKVMAEEHPTMKLEAAYKKIRTLEDRNRDVRRRT